MLHNAASNMSCNAPAASSFSTTTSSSSPGTRRSERAAAALPASSSASSPAQDKQECRQALSATSCIAVMWGTLMYCAAVRSAVVRLTIQGLKVLLRMLPLMLQQMLLIPLKTTERHDTAAAAMVAHLLLLP
jgi:hypothetical protein